MNEFDILQYIVGLRLCFGCVRVCTRPVQNPRLPSFDQTRVVAARRTAKAVLAYLSRLGRTLKGLACTAREFKSFALLLTRQADNS